MTEEGGGVRATANSNCHQQHQRPPPPSNLRGGVANALIIKTNFFVELTLKIKATHIPEIPIPRLDLGHGGLVVVSRIDDSIVRQCLG